MVIKIMSIDHLRGNTLVMNDGTIYEATLPEMLQIATEGTQVIHGMDIVIEKLGGLYKKKAERAEELHRKIALSDYMSAIITHDYVSQYESIVCVLDGVGQSIDEISKERNRLIELTTRAKRWLNAKGVII